MKLHTFPAQLLLSARLWKDVTMEHFRLSEKQWQLYMHELHDFAVILNVFDPDKEQE